MAGFDNDVVYAANVDFSGGDPVAGQITANGQLLIGASSAPYLRPGTLTAGTGISITNSAGGIQIDAAVAPSQLVQQGQFCSYQNLSISLSSQVLTLAGADGTALSASNPAYVWLPSNATTGRWALHTITSNLTWTLSEMNGNLFGISAATWANSQPLYFGFTADANDENLQAVVTRVPSLQQTSSNSAFLGDPSSSTADQEASHWFWDDVTEANYTSKYVGYIGSVTATYTSNVWTIDALTFQDGVGHFQINRVFTYPRGQMGAVSTTHLRSVSGTEPEFGLETVVYFLPTLSTVTVAYTYSNCTTPGSGTASVQPTVPYGMQSGGVGVVGMPAGYYIDSSAGNRIALAADQGNGSTYIFALYYNGIAAAMTLDDVDTGDGWGFTVTYGLRSGQ